jgi:endonuclease-3
VLLVYKKSELDRPEHGSLNETAFRFSDRYQAASRVGARICQGAMFELADEGFVSTFEQLVACIISIRTFEEVTLSAARKLFAAARTPTEVAALSVQRIDDLIHPCTFHRPKAKQIHAIAQRIKRDFHGELLPQRELVMTFRGVGPKCANLAIGVSTGKAIGIPVDIHVHRVANRWGVIAAGTPEQSMEQLQKIVPRRYWLEINKLLVPFGKFICRSPRPRCPHCPLRSMCRQVGVNAVDPTPPPQPLREKLRGPKIAERLTH